MSDLPDMTVTLDPFGPSCPLPIERLVEEINLYKGLTCTVEKHTLRLVGKRLMEFWELPRGRWKLTITETESGRSEDFFVSHMLARHGIDVECVAKRFVREFDRENNGSNG